LLVPLFEWLLFPASTPRARPLLLKVTLGLPAAAMLMVLGSYFFSTHSYEWFRDFTLSERLLSQSRALGYYLWRYLIPGVGYVGLYADGFEKSVGLLQPVSTLIWIAVHVLIIALAVVYARRLPLLSLGVLFFYVAHSMESGAIPLELFFEHRNYLPSMLLLLGVMHVPRQKVAIMTLLPVVVICAALQYLQSTFWGDERHLNTIMVVENPTSERALVAYANYLERQGELVDSLVVMKQYIEQYPYGMDIALNAVKMACFLAADSKQDALMLEESTAKYRGKAEPVVRQVGDIARWIGEGRCRNITFDHLERFLDSYMNAYPRDREATQAQYVARSYLYYYRGDYARFHQHMTAALDAHPNLSLTYSACSQFAVIGGPEHGCECFRKYEYILNERTDGKRTLVQKLLRWTDSEVVGYKSEATAVCAAAEAEALEGDGS
jgi:tetratricopeptide (TPR) repeat protein